MSSIEETKVTPTETEAVVNEVTAPSTEATTTTSSTPSIANIFAGLSAPAAVSVAAPAAKEEEGEGDDNEV